MPLYDNIIDAYTLSPAGGTVTVDLVGATLETNEGDITCSPPGWSVWLKIDLSALVGMGTGKAFTLSASTASGGIFPNGLVYFDPTGTFDPSSPDFDLLVDAFDDIGLFGDPNPPDVDYILNPDLDGNPTGIYWIQAGDHNCASDGEIEFDWTAFTDPPEPIVTTTTADVPDDSDATVHGTIDPNGTGGGHYWFEYGTTIGYGSSTSHLTYSGSGFHNVNRNLSGLTPATLYHYRLCVQRTDTGETICGGDETFTTLPTTDPSTGVTLDPDNQTCEGCVRFNATVDPDAADTIWQFKYHLGTSGGSGPTTTGGVVPGGSGPTTVHETICGLTAGRRYQVKILDSNWNGGTDGDWVTFDMPMCDFGTCAALVSDFSETDCAFPGGTTGPPGVGSLSGDGLRIKDGELMSLNTTDTWQRQILADLGDAPTGATGVDWWITLTTVDAAQGIMVPDSLGGYYGVRHDSGTVYIIQFDGSFAETVLDSGSATLADGDLLGLRWQGTTFTAEVSTDGGVTWTAVATATVPVDYYDARSSIVIGEMINTPFVRAIDTSIAYDLSAYGDSGSSAAIFPPFSCPDNHAKYSWSYDGSSGGDPGGTVSWAGPYYGGTADSDITPRDCPVWWLDLGVYVFGRIDCYNAIWCAGDCGFDQSSLAGYGATFALVPFYPDTVDYHTEIAQLDSDNGSGFFTFDSDSKQKGYAAIEATLDLVQAAYAGTGAYKDSKVDGGGRHAYGVFQDVAINPARMDDLFGGYGCSLASTRRRPQIWRYR